MKQLVAYFSHVGENIVNGDIVNLTNGNTEIVAERISALTGADLFKIIPEIPYPNDYEGCNARAKEEADSNQTCDFINEINNLDDYDTVYIGFPIWYRGLPVLVAKFVKSFDFSGKKVVPFCTNDEGSFGTSILELTSFAKGALVKQGLAIHGSKVNNCDEQIIKWMEINK